MTTTNDLWNHLPGEDNIYRTELPNGMVVLSKADFTSPSVVVSGYLQCGAINDPDEKLGLGLFTSYALMRGTVLRRHRKIYNELETAGASLGFGASIQSTNFGGRALSEDLPMLIKTISESIRWPVFPPTQLKLLLSQILTGLYIRQQDTGERVSLRFDEILFPNHPYGRVEEGTIETITRIRRSDLVKFHRNFYSPKGMVIVVVGAVEPNKVVDMIYKEFGDWKNPAWVDPPAIPSVPLSKFPYREHIEIPGKFQTDIIMGNYGPKRTSDDFLIASVGNNILGQFGMMGRIGEAVRDKSGLAYFASTALNSWQYAGTWEISAGVNPNNIETTINIIQEEILRFLSEPVTNQELEDSKANIIGMIPLSIESNAGVASAIVRMERYKLGLNYLRQFPELISKISKKEILSVANKYLDPKNTVIISAGTKNA
jgi:zinc protease